MHTRLFGARVAPMWGVTLLAIIAVIATSCGAVSPAPSAATATTVAPTATPEAASPTVAAVSANPTTDLPVGVNADGSFYRGNPDAAVKLVEFSDFECPYCSRHSTQTEPELEASYVATGQVVHIFRNFPLDFHASAMPAAVAAYCAGQQDPKLFWQMHDWLFANQDTWAALEDAAASFRSQALTFGADGDTLDACIASPVSQTAIDNDRSTGMSMGVSGTPAFFINDWFISGAAPVEQFAQAIENAKQGVHPTPAPPTPTPLPEGVQVYDVLPDRPGITYDGSPSLGEADARLILIVFEDYKCGYCAENATTVEPVLRTKYVDPGQLRVVFKFFPIYAPKAAIASLCALDQDKFWEFHDLLFERQADWEDGDNAVMIGYAKEVGLDAAKFEQCLSEPRWQQQIASDQELGQQLGISGTPYFLLLDVQGQSGLRLPGALPIEQFDAAIDSLLNPVTPTPEPSATPQ